MSRTLSSAALQALFAQETGEALLFLVVVSHDDWAEPLRLVNNNEDISSGGNVYSAFPVEIELPKEDAEQIAKTSIRICNVDRQITAALRELQTPPMVSVSIILGSTPDTVEAGPFEFELQDYSYDQFTVTGTLAYEDVLNEPLPSHTFNPSHFPGLF